MLLGKAFYPELRFAQVEILKIDNDFSLEECLDWLLILTIVTGHSSNKTGNHKLTSGIHRNSFVSFFNIANTHKFQANFQSLVYIHIGRNELWI